MVSVVLGFHIEKGKIFHVDLHHIQNTETGQRSTLVENARKSLFYPEIKIL